MRSTASGRGRFGSPPGQLRNALRLVLTVLLLFTATAAPAGFSLACSKNTKAFPELMGTVPGGIVDFTYWNIKALMDDRDLWDIFDTFEASADAGQVEKVVVVLANVEQAARAVAYDNASLSGPVAVFRGDLDVNYIKAQLEEQGYGRSANKEAAVWLPPEGGAYTKAMALRDSTVYLGRDSDLIECITAASTKSYSLRDNPFVKSVTDRLPDGAVVTIHRADATHGEQYAGLVAYGKSYSKANRDTLSVTAVYLFGHAPAARDAEQPIEDFSTSSFDDVTVKSDGNLVLVTARVPVTRFARLLEF